MTTSAHYRMPRSGACSYRSDGDLQLLSSKRVCSLCSVHMHGTVTAFESHTRINYGANKRQSAGISFSSFSSTYGCSPILRVFVVHCDCNHVMRLIAASCNRVRSPCRRADFSSHWSSAMSHTHGSADKQESKTEHKAMGFGTTVIHAGQDPDPVSGAVCVPISLATTFVQKSPGKPMVMHRPRLVRGDDF
jgi:hypothetical protein